MCIAFETAEFEWCGGNALYTQAKNLQKPSYMCIFIRLDKIHHAPYAAETMYTTTSIEAGKLKSFHCIYLYLLH